MPTLTGQYQKRGEGNKTTHIMAHTWLAIHLSFEVCNERRDFRFVHVYLIQLDIGTLKASPCVHFDENVTVFVNSGEIGLDAKRVQLFSPAPAGRVTKTCNWPRRSGSSHSEPISLITSSIS